MSSGGTTAGGSPPVARGSVSTRGGYVAGGCQSGLIELSASPAVGWELDDVSSGSNSEGRVTFEQSGEGEGKVEVRAWCSAGQPQFGVENKDDGDDGGGGSGGSSGSGGSTGSEDDR